MKMHDKGHQMSLFEGLFSCMAAHHQPCVEAQRHFAHKAIIVRSVNRKSGSLYLNVSGQGGIGFVRTAQLKEDDEQLASPGA